MTISNQFGPMRTWTEDEDVFIRANAFMDAEEMAGVLGRSVDGLRTRASRHLKVRLGRLCEDGAARAAYVWSRIGEQLQRHLEPDPFGGCWLWSGVRQAGGYGKVTINGATHLVHRVSWQVHRGPIPEELCVLHRCDVPACWNPAHLFLGTDATNAADRDAKGRGVQRQGELNTQAVLDEVDAKAIRGRAVSGEDVHRLAAEFGVSVPTVYDIKAGRSWSHLS